MPTFIYGYYTTWTLESTINLKKEKGPVDLFPTEPTDEARKCEETLDPGFRNSLLFVRKMG